jgi:hypothetical protein
MKNLFNSVKMTKLQTNMFDLSHDVKLSCDMGQLVPIMCLECIPGDRHTISAEALVRFAPLTAPVMHRYDISIHYFFCPNRILWPNWEKYITNTPNDETNPPTPYIHPYLEFNYDGQGSTCRLFRHTKKPRYNKSSIFRKSKRSSFRSLSMHI